MHIVVGRREVSGIRLLLAPLLGQRAKHSSNSGKSHDGFRKVALVLGMTTGSSTWTIGGWTSLVLPLGSTVSFVTSVSTSTTGAGAGKWRLSGLSRSRALTISFNSATSGDTPEVEALGQQCASSYPRVRKPGAILHSVAYQPSYLWRFVIRFLKDLFDWFNRSSVGLAVVDVYGIENLVLLWRELQSSVLVV
ncbi:hypothetical protein Tco_0449506 [Tanacetum coccineum]